MRTDAYRHSGVIKALTPTLRSAATIPAAQQGYTLVELLVGVALGSVVLSSLGVVLMLSQVKVSANIQRNIDVKDAVNRATDLMRREATFSSFIAPGSPLVPTGSTPLSNCVDGTPIRYPQRNNVSDVCYKLVNRNSLPAIYRAAYQGPCTLVRLGPPYKPNGDLDPSATPIVQVLLDGIVCSSTTGFVVTLGSSLYTGTTPYPPINRNADISIKMVSGASYRFSVRSPDNPAYDGNALYDLCTQSGTGNMLGCARDPNQVTYHFKPLMNSTTEAIGGQNSKENVFYFKYPFSEYVLSRDSGTGSCSFTQCYVERNGMSVRLSKVDSLIFSDQEIRVYDDP